MKYERFEQLPVWQAAIDLAERAFLLTRRRGFAPLGDLRDQLRRAALSVSNNIAEGFERGTTAELLTFLYIARGSAGEVRSMLRFCERLLRHADFAHQLSRPARRHADSAATAANAAESDGRASNLKSEISNVKSGISNLKSEISNVKSEISELKKLAESCSRQLRAWADHLQNSDIPGQRRLTDQSRRAYGREKVIDAFWKKLQAVRDAAAAGRPELAAALAGNLPDDRQDQSSVPNLSEIPTPRSAERDA